MTHEVERQHGGGQASNPAGSNTGQHLGRTAPRISRAAIIPLGVTAFYVAIIVAFSAFVPGFATSSNWANILAASSVIAIVTFGQCFVIVCGGFDLAVGGVVPLGGVLYARLTIGGMTSWQAIVLVIVAGAGIGSIIGLIVTQLNVNPFIATLGMLSVTTGLAYALAGGLTLSLDPKDGWLGDPAIGTLPTFVLVAGLLFVVCAIVLRWSVFGRRIYAVGGNAEAAYVAGVNVSRVQIAVFMLSSALAAIGGIVASSQVLAATGALGSTALLTSIAAVVLGGAALSGGTGGMGGALIGVLLIGTVNNALSLFRVPSFYGQMISGAILLFAVTSTQLYQRYAHR